MNWVRFVYDVHCICMRRRRRRKTYCMGVYFTYGFIINRHLIFILARHIRLMNLTASICMIYTSERKHKALSILLLLKQSLHSFILSFCIRFDCMFAVAKSILIKSPCCCYNWGSRCWNPFYASLGPRTTRLIRLY